MMNSIDKIVWCGNSRPCLRVWWENNIHEQITTKGNGDDSKLLFPFPKPKNVLKGCHLGTLWNIFIVTKIIFKGREHRSGRPSTLAGSEKESFVWDQTLERKGSSNMTTPYLTLLSPSQSHSCGSLAPYSPDLSPCDFSLFTKLKNVLK